MELSQSIAHLADALCKAQSQMKEILKTKTAQVKSDKGSYSYKYAELADLLEAVKPALLGQGLAISQGVDSYELGVKVTTLLMHSSGEHLSSTLSLPVSGSTPQAYGSAITYARRYALSALLGVGPEDDDDGGSGLEHSGSAQQHPGTRSSVRDSRRAGQAGHGQGGRALQVCQRGTGARHSRLHRTQQRGSREGVEHGGLSGINSGHRQGLQEILLPVFTLFCVFRVIEI